MTETVISITATIAIGCLIGVALLVAVANVNPVHRVGKVGNYIVYIEGARQ